jgi:hypothetical protein
MDDVWLTEYGQSRLTEATLDFDDDLSDSAEGQCQGWDRYLSVNDLGLCDDCAGKLDRDLIRQGDRPETGAGLNSLVSILRQNPPLIGEKWTAHRKPA